ncbi:nicotinamide riboside transporter PnuC [Chitinophagaceae bacterium MMS25-I14]
MTTYNWYSFLIAQLQQTSPWEWAAMLFGVWSVFLARANNVWLYPTGIISTVIYVGIFVQPAVRLYADALLNLYYLFMSIYGWILWTRKRGEEVTIHSSGRKDWSVAVLIAFLGWILLYYILKKYTNSDVPVWDAFVSATAWSGMWLLAKHKVENWIMLNISNLAAIPLYMHKQLPLTALLTVILFIVAIFGYFEWKKKLNSGSAQNALPS